MGSNPTPSPSFSNKESLDTAHVRPQNLRHIDAAVGLLVVLHYRDQGAADRQSGAVQGVHQLGFPGLGVAPARLHAPRLEVAHVRARRDLTVFLLPRQPHLDVVGLAGAEAHVASAEQHHPIGQFQLLQHSLGGARHALQFRFALALAALLWAVGPIVQNVGAQPAADAAPDGFTPLFNGHDLTGWRGLAADPRKKTSTTKEEFAKAQAKADGSMRAHWRVVDGVLEFDGEGESLCTARDYGNFELYVDTGRYTVNLVPPAATGKLERRHREGQE